MTSKSKALSLLVTCLLVASLFAGTAAAVSTDSDDIPDEVEVGTQTEATFELTDLYDEFESWTLRGETNLTNVTWTIVQIDQTGSQVSQQSYDGGEFTEEIDADDGTNRVEVRVTGTAPEIAEFRYDPPERFTFANFTLERGGGTERAIDSYAVHHYTDESKEARESLDEAHEAVERSGDSDAQSSFDSAVSAYQAADFDNAITLAERAEGEASQAETTRTLLLYGGLGVVAIAIIVGGVYVYRSRKKPPSRLR